LQVANKLGETIYKGHRSYDLMLNLQLGIRHSVQQVARKPTLEQLSDDHFKQKVTDHCCGPGVRKQTI
jgi:1-phosphatidylinositol-4-phosphate 5-kinase